MFPGKKQEESTGVLLAQLAFGLAAVPLGALIQTWAIWEIWNWHAVSALGAKPLTMWSALGLSCLVSAFGMGFVKFNEGDVPYSKLVSQILGKWLGYCLLVWLAYWAI